MSLWDKLLQVVGSLVSPDWAALLLLIPIGLAIAVAGYLAWVVRRYAAAGPQVSRPLPVAPVPEGIHMPGPSLAPFLAAGGAFALVLSTLFIKVTPGATPGTTTVVVQPMGVVALAIGLLSMIGALLYWGREASREYDRLEPPTTLPAVAAAGPPEGVHLPGPSFRPLLAAIASATLLLGLVVDPAILFAGILMTVIGLLGWLNDARKEYRETERADITGHLENIPAPRFPTGTFIVFAVLFVGSVLVAGGVFPPRGGTSGSSGGTAGGASAAPATPAPGASGAATGAPAGSAAASPAASSGGGGGGAAVVLKIAASGVAYDTASLEAPANTPFQIVFTNNDAGVPHNVSIHQGSPTGPEVWKGEIFSGVDSRTYDVPALPAGTYGFVCTVHANMTGTLTVK
jgi:plastocyanin